MQDDANTDITPTVDGFDVDWSAPNEDDVPKWRIYTRPEGATTWDVPPAEVEEVTSTDGAVRPAGAEPGKTYDVKIVPVSGPPGQETENPNSIVSQVTLSECTTPFCTSFIFNIFGFDFRRVLLTPCCNSFSSEFFCCG